MTNNRVRRPRCLGDWSFVYSFVIQLALHFQQQHRHLHFVAHFVDSRPVKYVADETVAVRRHRNENDMFLPSEFDDLVRGFAQRQDGVAGKALRGQLANALFQIGAVLLHLFALGELELIEIARHPAIGHMNEEQLRARHSCKRLDMGENGLIGWTVLERDEDMAVHFKNDEKAVGGVWAFWYWPPGAG